VITNHRAVVRVGACQLDPRPEQAELCTPTRIVLEEAVLNAGYDRTDPVAELIGAVKGTDAAVMRSTLPISEESAVCG